MCVYENSIYSVLAKDTRFTKFKKVVDHAGAAGILMDRQFDGTLFPPSDNHLSHIPDVWFDRMDNGLAQQILQASIINRSIDKDLITSSPVSYFNTRNPQMLMYVTNISGKTRINECANIIEYDLQFDNGIIHILDNIIVPTDNTYLN